MNSKRTQILVFNIVLSLVGTGCVFSGFLLQIEYHMGHAGVSETVWGFDYAFWSWAHKISSLLFFPSVAFHLFNNRRWIKRFLAEKAYRKHKQVVAFAGIFAIAAVMGIVAWTVSMVPAPVVRKGIVELHDKITIVLSVFLVLHVLRRRRRI